MFFSEIKKLALNSFKNAEKMANVASDTYRKAFDDYKEMARLCKDLIKRSDGSINTCNSVLESANSVLSITNSNLTTIDAYFAQVAQSNIAVTDMYKEFAKTVANVNAQLDMLSAIKTRHKIVCKKLKSALTNTNSLEELREEIEDILSDVDVVEDVDFSGLLN